MAEAAEVLPKGRFAVLCGVTPGRVSQWISEGKIHGPALEGEGRSAKIVVAIAREQMRGALDVTQRLGLNGMGTRLDDPAPGPALPSGAPTVPQSLSGIQPKDPTVEDRIKDERLRQLQAQNRRLAEEERARAGLYMRTEDAKQDMARVAAQMMKVFEGGLADMAGAVAAKFGLTQRDVVHVLRSEFRGVRASAARALRQTVEGMDRYLEDDDGIGDGNPSGEPGEGGDAGPG